MRKGTLRIEIHEGDPDAAEPRPNAMFGVVVFENLDDMNAHEDLIHRALINVVRSWKETYGSRE